MAICELQGVSKDYGSGPARVRALHDVTIALDAGEFTVFSGPSGSGKTTLLNLIGCLDTPTEGTVRLEGQELGALSQPELAKLRARRIGFIFQSFNLIPVLTAVENVELALQLSGDHDRQRDRSVEMLAEMGLSELVHRRPNQLSGGQQQRVAVARALVKRPALVIADEPTANLDSENGEQILEIMRRMNDKLGITFLFSTHDPMVMAHARRNVHLRDGRVEEDDQRAVAPAEAEE